jgi:hypothetical protein
MSMQEIENQTRAPMLRYIGSDEEQKSMNLPEGATCANCRSCRRCTTMFGHIPADEVCDWYPSRFTASTETI